MALFDVPGWSMPTDVKPVGDASSRKRKRGAGDESSCKLQSAEVNLEKLMESLNKERGGLKPNKNREMKHNDKPVVRQNERKGMDAEFSRKRTQNMTAEPVHALTAKSKHEKSKKRVKKDQDRQPLAPDEFGDTSSGFTQAHPRNDGHAKPKAQKRKEKEEHKVDGISERPSKSDHDDNTRAHLTSLQSKMKQSLDGARFRWINEMLYKSNSRDAERLMHEDPWVFEDYHTGFRHQVTSWPANPVDHFVKTLSSYSERSVIVDLGCGDAALAQKLVPKGYTVLSFDLISANPFIVAADICEKLPIPGSETGNEGQVVDVVICSLSLMSTNWLNCIREARRILKRGGELKIAEVTSRFTNVDKFTSVICSVGFQLVLKDERNSHFTLFDFKKAEGSKIPDDKVWQKQLSRGDVLQPCEYKRR